ncbi:MULTISPECIES: CPBP family intramembrane glutamic endopeptidase [Stenotrophomonas]|uniref:CPBP family intramembrane metalloprotease n=2 Tax=Stenotrophomonas maltophilia group TaxID=995085 RepID=A0A1A6XJ09_STEMA|nr:MULTISPECIES: CPBP family intramembrane glutamic endopeptidase [Stenotrophomonas]QCZ95603.1 CPBP family intramembrane metalloprotease [Stenotrophomonas sp. pho]AYA92620.1 CPBP family intramembrane metalloprotease [Stenotrophomonas sp. Pemsol]KOQ67550.1 membrane protein [Stenotrophomonas maltophilia]MBH1588989.1 CPBP family intramembrane metalloprotease [Stenotrophomonas maltophilia]MBN4958354.1 CPBP family intramembrane metalloprotease [Stenotrophomonas maltophilia]
MSASTPVSAAPPPVPPVSTPPRAVAPLAGFFIDLGIAAVTLVGLSMVSGLFWGFYRAIVVSRANAEANGGLTPDAVGAAVGQPGALAQILMALIATGGAALLLYFWRRPASAGERMASRQALLRPSTWGWTLLVATLIVLGSNGIAFLSKQFGIEPVPTNVELMQSAIARFPLFLVLFAVVLAPAYEELLFRRVLFGRLWQAGRPWLGLILSSLAFALVHEVPGVSKNSLLGMAQLWLVYGGMGAAFCWLYRRTGTLWAAIAAHALNNAVALAAMVFLGST